MQKLLSYTRREKSGTGFLSPEDNLRTPGVTSRNNNSKREDKRYKEYILEAINNHLKSPAEIEAEFILITRANTTAPLPSDKQQKPENVETEAFKTLFVLSGTTIVFPEFMEENY